MKLSLVIAASVLIFAESLHAQVYDWAADALPGVKINTVAYKGWIPAGQQPLKGTLVLIPGRWGDGRHMAADKRWQALATDVGFAVIGCQFTNGEPFDYQNDPKAEVAKSINDAVDHLAKESGHPELSKAPLAFWGTSAGSNVSARYCCHFPKRVIAFASSKGTFGPSWENPPGRNDIPMFFALGAKDKPDWLSSSQGYITGGIKAHAPWALAFQNSEGHEVGKSLDVAIPFLKGAITMRFNPPAVSAGSSGAAMGGGAPSIFKSQLPSFSQPAGSAAPAAAVQLHRIDPHAGWLGNPDNYEVASYATFKGDKNKAMWLPDETTALAWQKYLQGQTGVAPAKVSNEE